MNANERQRRIEWLRRRGEFLTGDERLLLDEIDRLQSIVNGHASPICQTCEGYRQRIAGLRDALASIAENSRLFPRATARDAINTDDQAAKEPA